MAREISTVGVVGLGTMGAGIVEVFAREGLTVVGLEVSDDALARGRGHLEGSTGKALERGKITEADRDALLGRVTFTTSYDDLAQCDLVVEAVPELMKLKQIVFGELDRVCKADAILATNTSSLSVTEIAMTTKRPASVIGMHFFNPAPVMKLVEVVSSVATDDEVTDAVVALARRIGKTPVAVGDRAGFVANYLLFGYLNRAVGMLASGYVGREDLDAAVKLGIGLPMGPLELLDLIGLDTAVEILDTMHAQTGDPAHVPAPLLKQHVVLGSLGRKTGRGFYSYEKGRATDAAEPGAVAPGDTATPARIGVAGDNPFAQLLADLYATLDGAEIVRGTESKAFADCDVVVEALVADVDDERVFLTDLAGVVGSDTTVLVAGPRANVTALATSTGLGARLLGFHVLEPTKRGRLVEVVTPSPLTGGDAEAAVGRAVALARALELVPIVVGDRAGYLVGGLLHPHLGDAIRMVDQGYATYDDVDNAMTLGCGYPLGLIAIADLLGLDRVLAMLERIHADEGGQFVAPAPLLRRHVAAGRLGRRTGAGFRDVAQAADAS